VRPQLENRISKIKTNIERYKTAGKDTLQVLLHADGRLIR